MLSGIAWAAALTPLASSSLLTAHAPCVLVRAGLFPLSVASRVPIDCQRYEALRMRLRSRRGVTLGLASTPGRRIHIVKSGPAAPRPSRVKMIEAQPSAASSAPRTLSGVHFKGKPTSKELTYARPEPLEGVPLRYGGGARACVALAVVLLGLSLGGGYLPQSIECVAPLRRACARCRPPPSRGAPYAVRVRPSQCVCARLPCMGTWSHRLRALPSLARFACSAITLHSLHPGIHLIVASFSAGRARAYRQ